MLHDVLWRRSRQTAEACLHHPFVRGLAEGTLPPAAFRRYVAQDAFFLRAFLRAYALAAAKCEDAAMVRDLLDLIGGVLDELQLHAQYARTLEIDLTSTQPLPATVAYTDFLERVAWHECLGEILAAMTPCMRLYAFLGRELAPNRRPDHPYDAWLATYSSKEFEALAARLEGLLDRAASLTPGVCDAYGYAMLCELDFFGAPLAESA